MEADLDAIVETWRDMPPVPSAKEYQQALSPVAFRFEELPPVAPDFLAAEATERDVMSETVLREHPPSLRDRLGPASIGVTAGLVGGLVLWAADVGRLLAGVGALLLAVIAGVIAGARLRQQRRDLLEARTESRMAVAWPTRREEIEAAHMEAVAAFAARSASAERDWADWEQGRVNWARRLVGGDLDAMHQAISGSLADLDFPFDTECALGLDETVAAFIALDLPEIEDVIPETRFRVLKSGQLKETKRKADERNAAYARLVSGLGVMMAAAAFAAAPTLETVTVGAYTQRRKRGSQEVEDQYVYEARIERSLFGRGAIANDENPIDLLIGQQTRLEWGAKHVLKKLAPPAWAAGLRGE